jgi:hypothetical protein
MKEKCPNPIFEVTNHDTGETYMMPCKSWDCPVCSKKKKYILTKYFAEQLEELKIIRLLTVNLRFNSGMSPQVHYQHLQEIWRRSITDIRRQRKEKQLKEVRILRINEMCKQGQAHIHALPDRYLNQKILYKIFNKNAKAVIKDSSSEQQVSVNIVKIIDLEGFRNNRERRAKIAASYVTKHLQKIVREVASDYCTKSIADASLNIHRPYRKCWSKTKGWKNITTKVKLAQKLVLKNIKTGVETLNLFYKAYLRNLEENFTDFRIIDREINYVPT